jgi:hypothetical protein
MKSVQNMRSTCAEWWAKPLRAPTLFCLHCCAVFDCSKAWIWDYNHLPITYSWTGLLILDHSYLVGSLTNSKITETKALEPKILTLLYQQFSNLFISQWDMSGPRLGALSNNRCLINSDTILNYKSFYLWWLLFVNQMFALGKHDGEPVPDSYL